MADTAHAKTTGTGTNDQSVGELVQQASAQISRLVRDELRLAQVELAQKGKAAGIGAGLFGGAGVLALYGVAGVLTAVVLGLAEVMPAWLAALIVGVVLLIIAGVMGLVGRKKVGQAAPPVPQEAVESVKADVDTVKERARR